MVSKSEMELHSIDQKIIQLLKSSSDIHIDQLGGVNNLCENINIIVTSRFIPEILKSIIDDFEKLNETEQKRAENFLIAVLEQVNDEFSIQEILNNFFNTNSRIKNSCYKVCLTQSANIQKKSIVRGWLLEASFRFALLDKSKRFSLLNILIEISIDDCPVYLRHASKILGIAYSNWQEHDLIEKLIVIKDANLGEDEVWFELGMSYLLDALNSQEHDKALTSFLLAKDHFEKTIEIGSERQDAEAYYNAILILTSLSNPNETLDYKKLIDKMYMSLTIYNSWHTSQECNEWVSARNTEIANWYILISKLEHLLIHLNEPSWFEPKVVIESYLLNIYTSSRSIFKRNKDGGLEKLIQPRIEGALISQESKIYVIEKWLESQVGSEMKDVGFKLKHNLRKAKCYHQNQSEYYFEKLNQLSSELPADKKSSLDQFFENCTSVNIGEINPITEQLLTKILKGVESNSSYKIDKVKRGFHILLNQSITFLESRMNLTQKDSKRVSYLFQKKPLPLEVALQDDFHDFLIGNLCDANITVEKSNVSGGRVDVNVAFGSFSFSAEIKREVKDCSFEAIKSKYLGQAAEYLSTDAKLGFLMVLDLTEKPSGMRTIESNIKVEIVTKENDLIERAIVVIVVPGNRNTPSKVKIKQGI